MALFRNSDSLLQLRKASHIQQASEVTPNVLGDRIIPTINIGDRKTNIWRVLPGAGTLITVPFGKIFNVTFAQISMTQAAGDTGSLLTIVATDSSGTSAAFITVGAITLTAEKDSQTQQFVPPLEVVGTVAGATITAAITGTFSSSRFIVGGYFTDNPNG